MTINDMNIEMIRGDTESVSVHVARGAALGDGDTVTFTVRADRDSDILLQKVVTDFPGGYAYINLESEDTAALDFGTYVYDIQLKRADGTVKTLVTKHKLKLADEVTY